MFCRSCHHRSLALARPFVIWYGSIQEPTCVQYVPRSLVYVLETVCTEEGATEISSDYDEDVVDVLGEDKDVNLEISYRMSYQNLEKMSQSTTCGGLPIVIIICQPMNDY